MTEKTKLSKLLIQAGYTPRVAKALAWIVKHGRGTITSRELEKGADLRQPEVVYALKVLTEAGWLKSIETKRREDLGRPFRQYEIVWNSEQAFSEILKLMEEKTKAITDMTAEIRSEIFLQTPNQQQENTAEAVQQ